MRSYSYYGDSSYDREIIYYLLSAIKILYWSHVTAFKKLSDERS